MKCLLLLFIEYIENTIIQSIVHCTTVHILITFYDRLAYCAFGIRAAVAGVDSSSQVNYWLKWPRVVWKAGSAYSWSTESHFKLWISNSVYFNTIQNCWEGFFFTGHYDWRDLNMSDFNTFCRNPDYDSQCAHHTTFQKFSDIFVEKVYTVSLVQELPMPMLQWQFRDDVARLPFIFHCVILTNTYVTSYAYL